MKYSGACALEYHSAIQIVMECLFGWDTKKCQGKAGILGTLEAFCEAIEEQGRGTLHGHFLIWIKNFDLLRRLLHSTDNNVKNKAKEEYIKYIDQVMSASHGLFPLDMNTNHTCTHCADSGRSIDAMYKNRESEKRAMIARQKTITPYKMQGTSLNVINLTER